MGSLAFWTAIFALLIILIVAEFLRLDTGNFYVKSRLMYLANVAFYLIVITLLILRGHT